MAGTESAEGEVDWCYFWVCGIIQISGRGTVGSALRLGRRGRLFESGRPDQFTLKLSISAVFLLRSSIRRASGEETTNLANFIREFSCFMFSGFGAVVARTPGGREVAGSIPVTPTKFYVYSGRGAVGSARHSGCRGRPFKSGRPDQQWSYFLFRFLLGFGGAFESDEIDDEGNDEDGDGGEKDDLTHAEESVAVELEFGENATDDTEAWSERGGNAERGGVASLVGKWVLGESGAGDGGIVGDGDFVGGAVLADGDRSGGEGGSGRIVRGGDGGEFRVNSGITGGIVGDIVAKVERTEWSAAGAESERIGQSEAASAIRRRGEGELFPGVVNLGSISVF